MTTSTNNNAPSSKAGSDASLRVPTTFTNNNADMNNPHDDHFSIPGRGTGGGDTRRSLGGRNTNTSALFHTFVLPSLHHRYLPQQQQQQQWLPQQGDTDGRPVGMHSINDLLVILDEVIEVFSDNHHHDHLQDESGRSRSHMSSFSREEEEHMLQAQQQQHYYINTAAPSFSTSIENRCSYPNCNSANNGLGEAKQRQ